MVLSTSTHPQLQVTMGTSILKSAKNTTSQVQTHAPSAIKKFQATANGSQPLQTFQAHAECGDCYSAGKDYKAG